MRCPPAILVLGGYGFKTQSIGVPLLRYATGFQYQQHHFALLCQCLQRIQFECSGSSSSSCLINPFLIENYNLAY